DTIICDYNYIFGQQTTLEELKAIGLEQEGKPNLVIDEAHNLPSRTMGQFSPVISTLFLESLEEKMEKLPKSFAKEGQELIEACLDLITSETPHEKRSVTVDLSVEAFALINEDLKSLLTKYLEADIEIYSQDPVLSLVFYWGEFVETLVNLDSTDERFFISGQNYVM